MDLKATISEAPLTPGVYFFKSSSGRVLYVGKAINLRARLKSYLRGGWKDEMLKEATELTWEELSSDLEALIREAELIKTLKPFFNILMRDDKNYSYVAITRGEFPRVYVTHQPFKKITRTPESIFIGPFTDGLALKRVLHLLRRAFPYCTCSSLVIHKRRCVNGEIGKCLGICCADIPATALDKQKYRANISAIKKVLRGKTKILVKTLEQKMETLSSHQKYEEAQIVRDQLWSLDRIFKHSPYLRKDVAAEREKALSILAELLKLPSLPRRIEGYDISHHQGDTTVASMVVFQDGIPQKSEYRKFIMRGMEGIHDPARMQETLRRRLRHPEWPSPDIILVDGGKGQFNAAHDVLKEKKKNIPLVALAKREEELYTELSKNAYKLYALPRPLLFLLTHIRDEAHRFAISFHRKRRLKLQLR